jgi:hypothetical protein
VRFVKNLLPWTPFLEGDWPLAVMAVFEMDPGYVGVFRNSRYQVMVRQQETPLGIVDWLAIVRLDREPIHDWRELQRVKNELMGFEREACEIYPAESRLVDTNNQYHLFVLPAESFFPFGYGTREVAEKVPKGAVHKQRPFEVKPPDLDDVESMKNAEEILKRMKR